MPCLVGQVALVGQPFAHILGQHQARGLSVEIELGQVCAHLEHTAVLAPVQAHGCVGGIAHLRPLDGTTHFVPAFARADVEDAHRQELVAAVAVLAHCSVVDLDEAQRVRVEHPERRRVAVEQQAEAAFHFAHLLARLIAFAQVGQRADHASFAVGHLHPLSARADPAHFTTGQHQAEHLVEHCAAGKGLVESLLQARGIIAMHAREEIRDRQGVGLYPKDLAGQRRPAQQRGVLIHVPGADTPDLMGQTQLGMARLQFLGHRLLAAGTAAHRIQQHQQHHDVGQHDRHRCLQVRPPGCQHVFIGQADLHRQRAAVERTDGRDARHTIDHAGQAAELDHRLLAEQVTPRQVVAATDRAMRIGHARQHVTLGVGDRDQPVGTNIQAAGDALQFTTAQPCQQPAFTGHRQCQRHHPVAIAGPLRRADVQGTALPPAQRVGPQRQLQVAAPGGQRAPVAVQHHDAVQFSVAAQHATDGRLQQCRSL